MSSLDARTPIEPSALQAAVSRLTGHARVVITGWRAEPLAGHGSPVTAGIFRLSGSYEAEDCAGTWSLVIKQTRAPGPGRYAGAGQSASDWGYWKREADGYRSSLFSRLPPGIAAPRCYGVTEPGPGSAWLWLEDLGHLETSWCSGDYERAAALLGRLAVTPVEPDAPWLSGGMLHDWVRLFQAGREVDLPHHPGSLLPLLDCLPQVLCHRDAAPPNLRLRAGATGDELVLIDWALCGIGPIGEDLGPLLMQAARDWPAAIAELPARLIAAYLQGLRAAGWRGDEREVWSGALIAALVRAELWQVRERQSFSPTRLTPLSLLIERLAQELAARYPGSVATL